MIPTIIAIAGILAIGATLLFIAAPRDGFETDIFIAAEPERVWSLLVDADAHSGWNPAMHAVTGSFVEGGRVELVLATPSGGAITFHPEILAVRPVAELRWRGRLFIPRLFDGEHYFLLTPENGGTRLVHGEHFQGIALWLMDVRQFIPVFDSTNRALKARAEGRPAPSPEPVIHTIAEAN